MKSPAIRLRVDFNAHCAVGPGKIQLLECIARTGSLSQAARELDMSYRRAWLLLDNMNTAFDTPVVSTQTGGKAGGGAELTAFGKQLIDAFRKLEAQCNDLAARQLNSIAKHASAPGKSTAANASVKRRTLVRSKRAASH